MRLTRHTEIAIDILVACAQSRNSIILTADAARSAQTSKDHAPHIVRLLMRSGFCSRRGVAMAASQSTEPAILTLASYQHVDGRNA